MLKVWRLECYESVIHLATSFSSRKDRFESASLLATLEGEPWVLLIYLFSLLPWSSLGWNLRKGEGWAVNRRYSTFVKNFACFQKLTVNWHWCVKRIFHLVAVRPLVAPPVSNVTVDVCIILWVVLMDSVNLISSSTQIQLRTHHSGLEKDT